MTQPDASGFSGAFSGVDSPRSMAAGGDLFKEAKKSGPSKADRPSLTTGDLSKLEDLLKAERDAIRARDKFCMEIERRYQLVGMVWDIDFKTGEIVIKGFREPKT